VDIRLSQNGNVYLTRREAAGQITLVSEDQEPRVLEVIVAPGGGYAVKTATGFHPADAVRDGNMVWVRFEGRTYRFELVRGSRRSRAASEGDLASPMPGQVQNVLVAEGDVVEPNQPLLVVEAMKMQLEIKAGHAGRVKKILVGEGDQVEAGVPLAELEELP
jgi:biotin carboxyl carrier protein